MIFALPREKKNTPFFNIAWLLGKMTLALQRYGRGGGVSFMGGVRKLDFSP